MAKTVAVDHKGRHERLAVGVQLGEGDIHLSEECSLGGGKG